MGMGMAPPVPWGMAVSGTTDVDIVGIDVISLGAPYDAGGTVGSTMDVGTAVSVIIAVEAVLLVNPEG